MSHKKKGIPGRIIELFFQFFNTRMGDKLKHSLSFEIDSNS